MTHRSTLLFAAVVALAVTVLIAAIVARVSGFDFFDCQNTVLAKVASPDGAYEATAFSRNCGATTPFSVHVFLGPIGEKMEDAGNVFRGTDSDKIAIRWKNKRTLEITTDAKVFLQTREYCGVALELVRGTPEESATGK